ncbi:MAG: hypothetical protein VW874_07065, partial [Gammaproteobacteria bacterium]
MPLDLTQELMNEYETDADSVGYAMLDDDDNVVGYVVEGEDTDPNQGVTAVTYEYYDELGQFEYIEYEFVQSGVEWVNTYAIDDLGEYRHVAEWKLEAGELAEGTYAEVNFVEWHVVEEITDHLPSVVWDEVGDQGGGTVTYEITMSDVSEDGLAFLVDPDLYAEPPLLNIVSDTTTIHSNTSGILAWFNVDGTADSMVTSGYYNRQINEVTINNIPNDADIQAMVDATEIVDITSEWEAFNAARGEEGHSEGGIIEQLTSEEMLAADSFVDDNGDTIYSVTGTVTED